jgi:hypothetical protein
MTPVVAPKKLSKFDLMSHLLRNFHLAIPRRWRSLTDPHLRWCGFFCGSPVFPNESLRHKLKATKPFSLKSSSISDKEKFRQIRSFSLTRSSLRLSWNAYARPSLCRRTVKSHELNCTVVAAAMGLAESLYLRSGLSREYSRPY